MGEERYQSAAGPPTGKKAVAPHPPATRQAPHQTIETMPVTELLMLLAVMVSLCLYLFLKDLMSLRPLRLRGSSVAARLASLAFWWAGRPRTISGRASVGDGDGILVSGQRVRFVGLDVPRWGQVARGRDGYWFNHGRHVKKALERLIEGKSVHVKVEDYDAYGRAVGIVTCNGEDVGEWLVREGHATVASGARYKHVEQEARGTRRGMWDHEVGIDPRAWQHSTSARN